MDFIIDLPLSKRKECVYNAILVVVDRFSKIVIYALTNKTCISVQLTSILIREIVRRFSILKGALLNRGSVFTSEY